MRVAIIAEVFLPKIDGVVNRTLNLIRQLRERGDEVLVVCPQAEGCRDCPAPVVEVPSFAFPLYPEYRVGLPDHRVPGAVRAFAPDVLHYVNPFAFGFRCYDVFHTAGLRAPTVFSFHTLYGEFVKRYRALGVLSPVLWWLMREYHNLADLNLTVSSVMQEDLTRRGFRGVRGWPPAVDTQVFHPSRRSPEMRERLSRGQPNRPLLLTVSRLSPEKNVEFLAGVIERVPEAQLAVVGDGPQRGELERRFGPRAHFVGYLKGQELASAYASADAFVYASATETMGNVVLEAMACSCPVVAPAAGGIPSLVTHGQTGLLFQPGDLDEAVRLTRSLLTDPALRDRLVDKAFETVSGWDWASSVERVREVYREAVAVHRPREVRATVSRRLARAVHAGLVSAFRAQAAVKPARPALFTPSARSSDATARV